KLEITRASIQAGFAVKNSELAGMDPFAIASRVTSVLEAHGIEYFLGGSIASTIHGEPRFTQDVDIVVRLKQEHVDLLLSRLEGEFYASQTGLQEAIKRRSSANLIHLETGFKIDLMISRERAFEASRFARKQLVVQGVHQFQVATAEDIILVKLEWYRLGQETSDRQWRDVLTVLMTCEGLDRSYLERWANELGVADLLARACREALEAPGPGPEGLD
ncbi:MAG: hypothetical protein KC910_33450, partial [Candidatus Eremiobacteraeota bacterium]|nr:hypothetical protein [Candidatus Eremiobacteraeota bacterium]